MPPPQLLSLLAWLISSAYTVAIASEGELCMNINTRRGRGSIHMKREKWIEFSFWAWGRSASSGHWGLDLIRLSSSPPSLLQMNPGHPTSPCRNSNSTQKNYMWLFEINSFPFPHSLSIHFQCYTNMTGTIERWIYYDTSFSWWMLFLPSFAIIK